MYESRLEYTEALVRMGTRIRENRNCDRCRKRRFYDDSAFHSVCVTGATPLVGSEIEVPDLRAGFAYPMAALMASGRSRLTGMHNIRRGYSSLEEKIHGLGGSIVAVGQNRPEGQPVALAPAS